MAFPHLFRPAGRLVEGWFVIELADRIVLNQHVWCELGEWIVDPSLLLLVPETTPVFYFAGLSRSWDETAALEGELFPHVCFDVYGRDGLGHPGYKAAREAARRKVYALSCAQQPPKAMQFLTAQDLDGVLPAQTEEPGAPISEEESLDLPLSLLAAQHLQAQAGQCWYNAREAMLTMPRHFVFAHYVEGWRVGQFADGIHVTEHGWIVTPHTGIVDPTAVMEQEVPAYQAYLPGLRLSWHELHACATASLPLARQRHMPGLLAYQHACHQALERGEQLAWQTGLPLLPEPGRVLSIQGFGGTVLLVDEISWDFPVPSTPSARVAALLREMAQEEQEL